MIVYVGHPLSGNVPGNTASVRTWIRYLIDAEPDVAFVCSWLPYVDVLDDANPAHRERGLRDCLFVAPMCDGIVLCGDRISDGMRMEVEAIEKAGGWVSDLTGFDRDEAVLNQLSPLRWGRWVWMAKKHRNRMVIP